MNTSTAFQTSRSTRMAVISFESGSLSIRATLTRRCSSTLGWLGVGVYYFGYAVHFHNESVWV
eukprot:SAG31_NODE_44904_length_261_cov_0.543210_1_plen_62_part_01